MQRSYTLLSILLGVCWSALFLLQATTHVFTSGSVVSASVQAPRAHVTMQKHQPNTQNPPATPTTVITGGQGGTNRLPDPAQGDGCFSGIMSTPVDLLKLLAPGWTINDLAETYRHETRRILCYDNWKSEWSVPGGTWLKIADFLTIMRWPADLFDPSAGTDVLIVSRPNDTLQSSNGTPPQNTTQNQTPNCTWSPDLGLVHPSIDICDLVGTILKITLLTPLKWGVNNLAGDTNTFVWTTPPQDTYANPDLSLFWSTSLSIVNALLAVVIAWAGLRYMISKSFGSWLSYADLLEMLPRLVMALIAAYVSVKMCQVVIDGSNALSSIFSTNLLSSLQDEPKDLFSTFMQILLCALILILVLEEAVRIAILFILIGFSPIWAFCGALKETQFIFKGALKALFFMSLLQPCQIAVMALGQHMITSIGGHAGTLLYTFVSIALMLLVLLMMSTFLRASGFSMPFGLVGAAGLALGARGVGRAIGGTVVTSGRGIRTTGSRAIRGASARLGGARSPNRQVRPLPSSPAGRHTFNDTLRELIDAKRPTRPVKPLPPSPAGRSTSKKAPSTQSRFQPQTWSRYLKRSQP